VCGAMQAAWGAVQMCEGLYRCVGLCRRRGGLCRCVRGCTGVCEWAGGLNRWRVVLCRCCMSVLWYVVCGHPAGHPAPHGKLWLQPVTISSVHSSISPTCSATLLASILPHCRVQ
jgi:hypothetical protein